MQDLGSSKCNRGHPMFFGHMVMLCFHWGAFGSNFTIPQILQRLVTIRRVHSKFRSEQLNLQWWAAIGLPRGGRRRTQRRVRLQQRSSLSDKEIGDWEPRRRNRRRYGSAWRYHKFFLLTKANILSLSSLSLLSKSKHSQLCTIIPSPCSFILGISICSLFGWLVADGWCWFVLREEYCWLVLAGCWWLVCSERKILLPGGW
jgi:hypothetical protein